MDVDESFKSNIQAEHKCYICQEEFVNKDEVKRHKKIEHPSNVQVCERFMMGKCERNEDQCWFSHKESTPKDNPLPKSSPLPQSSPLPHSNPWFKSKSPLNQKPVFQNAPRNPFPPEQMTKMMEAVTSLCMKVEKWRKNSKR